jgi:hypothetical protein
MAKATLPTNFKDDVLASAMGGKRRYNMIHNSDGTVSFEDVTNYTQVGSTFGAAQINATNEAVNNAADASKIIDSLETIKANTQSGYIAGALAVKALSSNLGKAIYLGEFTNEWTNQCTFTTSKNIPEGYIIVLSDIRIRVNGVDAVQRFKFNAERASSSTFNIYVSDYNVSPAGRYGTYSFKAYAINI